MEETAKTKKQFIIFLLIAYGVTYLMGLLVWYGSAKSLDINAFANAQMFYPAAGVMLALLVTQWKDEDLPKPFFICFLAVTAVMIVCCIMSLAAPGEPMTVNGQTVSLWNLISQYVIIVGSVIGWVTLLISRWERREEYGLRWNNFGASVFCIAVFLALYFGRAALSYIMDGQADMIAEIAKNPTAWLYLIVLPVNFLLAFMPFLGEEYGWRYYLQPLLQKKFGMRRGIFVLGLMWGLWHIFLDFFFYTTPDRGLVMTVSQIITCTGLGIFFAWTYMKTENIWVPTLLHYLNNNLILVVSNEYSADVLQNQDVSWGMIPAALLLNGAMFGWVIWLKEFRKKEESGEN